MLFVSVFVNYTMFSSQKRKINPVELHLVPSSNKTDDSGLEPELVIVLQFLRLSHSLETLRTAPVIATTHWYILFSADVCDNSPQETCAILWFAHESIQERLRSVPGSHIF